MKIVEKKRERRQVELIHRYQRLNARLLEKGYELAPGDTRATTPWVIRHLKSSVEYSIETLDVAEGFILGLHALTS